MNGHAIVVYLKWPIFIKIFLEENLIWQCRLMLVLHGMLNAMYDLGEGFVHTFVKQALV